MPGPERIVGIYGYEFVKAFELAGIEFLPLYQYPESRKRARDSESLQLTGYGRFTAPARDYANDADKVDLIVSGMTFLQQREVVGSSLIDISEDDSIDSFTRTDAFRRPLSVARPRHSFGDRVQSDVWRPESRVTFLRTFLQRFEIERLDDALRQAFFRHIEIWRLATPLVEIHHFLAFSALELLARSRGALASQGSAAMHIAKMLNDFGFRCSQEEVQRWSDSRNRAFHRGQLTMPGPRNGPDIRLVDQLVPLTSVLGDVLLKVLPFDDGHINWNRWRDGMAFR